MGSIQASLILWLIARATYKRNQAKTDQVQLPIWDLPKGAGGCIIRPSSLGVKQVRLTSLPARLSDALLHHESAACASDTLSNRALSSHAHEICSLLIDPCVCRQTSGNLGWPRLDLQPKSIRKCIAHLHASCSLIKLVLVIRAADLGRGNPE